ncbi:hypothetical protein [Streptomyces marianii]|uniref:Uncharacterized protein n=1 Tax=Streptomyces marianii TaxID=1817406 RepID=A0A5R9E0K4_9ACTN|nr:hypothetical protein [Streptomyces marianii]TLQ43471.1 hypothetical protein FEF34_10225 [Streptomyces marianii]
MERTDRPDLDALLARILTEPTRAARLLTETAQQLEHEWPHLAITEQQLNAAGREATRTVLDGLPKVVADEANERARAVCPRAQFHGGETAGEYALRLRDAAKAL